VLRLHHHMTSVRFTPSWLAVLAWIAIGCGKDQVTTGPDLVRADVLFVAAHMDDDMIFMQPALKAALANGSVTTVYVASGDPIYGDDRAAEVFAGAMNSYAAVTGSSDWQCGYVMLSTPLLHCRLSDRPVSLIGLDLADGGIEGYRRESLLHLVEQRIEWLPILGAVGGRATIESIRSTLAEIIVQTNPNAIHALELAGTHGRDHSSHMFSSSFAWWGAAQAEYAGSITWHRGYNVADEPITLSDEDYASASWMLGFFEACYGGCAPCGERCEQLPQAHEVWIRRQHEVSRVRSSSGALVAADGLSCVIRSAGKLAVGTCADAAQLELASNGKLIIDGQCVSVNIDDQNAIEPCAAQRPEQFWAFDSEGMLWNGKLPTATQGMDYDHVRCFAGDMSPVCGSQLHPRWRFAEMSSLSPN
jgi:hypothetical protein